MLIRFKMSVADSYWHEEPMINKIKAHFTGARQREILADWIRVNSNLNGNSILFYNEIHKLAIQAMEEA